MEKQHKRQLGCRVPELTHRQIKKVMDLERMTQGEVVALAVERLWQEMKKELDEEIERIIV